MCLNGDLRQKIGDYLQDRTVYTAKKRNVHTFTALAQAVIEEPEWRDNEGGQVEQSRRTVGISISPVEEVDGPKCQTELVTYRFSRYSDTPYLFKEYTNSNDEYSDDPSDDFFQNYPLFKELCNQAEVDSK